MGWGGGFGGGGGGFVGAQAAATQAGLPFGGIPTELQRGVDQILATEPVHPPSEVAFTQRPSARDARRLSIAMLVADHPVLVAIGTLLVLVVGALGVVGPLFVGQAIDKGMNPKHFDLTVVLGYAAAYLVAAVTVAYAQRALVHTTGRLAARVMHRLRILVFTHLQRLSLDFFTEEKAGVLMSRMTSDIENLQQFLQDGISSFGIQLISMLTIIGILLTQNVGLAVLTIVSVLPLLLVMTIWFHRASERGYLRARDGIANVLSDLSESLYGIRVVTATNRQRYNVVHHRNVVGEYRDANLYTGRANAIYGPATLAIGILGQALILGVGGTMVLHHQMPVGVLVTFMLYLGRFFQPIQLLVQQYNMLQQGRSSITRLRELVETPPSVDERPDATELAVVDGAIRFSDITFGYDPQRPVLSHVDLDIAPGESVAFVGPTGAGKSTMAKLVNRFYDPQGGKVLVDGVDIKGVTLHSLRSQIGVVPQEPFLFAGSIRDNLVFANPDATDADVDEAIDAVGLRELVDRLPAGMATVVHERGQTLSAGERQLLALGRAFLSHPRVLVLDEATSSLDLRSETVVEHALTRLLEGRTAILIAHRLTTARRADRIVVIEDGGIVESGSHDALVALGGRYAAMYDTWVRQGGLGEDG
ncbi:MAG TPA: ABC transporter ATP-binding protein [Acidimicrobiales bacterium]|jgi:ATP-binding cassette subfamily B protein|nr:ABC transporter ATP-binding protein [Acidimicrobiales bacterium]